MKICEKLRASDRIAPYQKQGTPTCGWALWPTRRRRVFSASVTPLWSARVMAKKLLVFECCLESSQRVHISAKADHWPVEEISGRNSCCVTRGVGTFWKVGRQQFLLGVRPGTRLEGPKFMVEVPKIKAQMDEAGWALGEQLVPCPPDTKW